LFIRTLSVLMIIFSLPSLASASIPDASVRQQGFDIGLTTAGFVNGANLEYGISDNLSVGADYLTVDLTLVPIFLLMRALGDTGSYYGDIYDAHLNWQLIKVSKEIPVNVSLMAGVGGVQTRRDSTVEDTHTIAVGGLCLSAPILTQKLIVRLNLVAGPPAGAEFAWKFTDNFEVNLGVTAMGIFGVKLSF